MNTIMKKDLDGVSKVAVVSGGFDPIHIGHVRMFRATKELPCVDYLIVIVNSDEFLKNKKGYAFMPISERMEIIAAFQDVDMVVPCFDDDQTVCKTLEYLKNIHGVDVFANGGDRKKGNVPEKEVCDRLGIEMVYGVGGEKIQSSSELVNKLK